MESLLVTLIGVLVAGLLTTVGAWWKVKEEARGWRVSYERERERADRQDRTVERAELATDIANKVGTAVVAAFAQFTQRAGSGTGSGGGAP